MTGDRSRDVDALFEDLRAELSVEPSPEFAMRVRAHIETQYDVKSLLGDLEAEIAEEPSPAFAAGVRARIDDARARRDWWRRWAWTPIAAAAAVAAVAATTAIVWRASSARPSPGATAVAQVEALAVPAPVAPSALPSAITTRAATAPAAATRASVTLDAAPSGADLRVIIVPSEAKWLRALIASLGDGRTVVPPGDVLFDEKTGDIVTPVLKEIPPIVIDLLPGSSDGRSGGSKDR